MTNPAISFPDQKLLDAVDRAARERCVSRSMFIRQMLERELQVEPHVPYSRSQTSE